ncbi:MAG: hypothetical protein PHE84_08030 [bacterium]|nr:hypothetical protein [bacterium]
MLIAPDVFAYLPPPERILAKTLKTMPDGTFLRARGTLELLPPETSAPTLAVSFRFYLAIPNQIKFEFFSPAYAKGLTVVVIKNNILLSAKDSELARVIGPELPNLLPALFSPFISEGIKALRTSLTGLGINVGQVSLEHFEREIVYRIGGTEAGNPGLWLSKDNFFPRRLELSREKPVRIDYLKYRFLENSTACPAEIDLDSGGKPWVKIRFYSIQLIPAFLPGFFSLK